MYVLEHSLDWWHNECKIKCPDCDTPIITDSNGRSIHINILEQDYVFWKRCHARKYDMQYRATFVCKSCRCKFKGWSPIIRYAGPEIGSSIIGDVVIRNWNGFVADKV